jgi:hypothetical protein
MILILSLSSNKADENIATLLPSSRLGDVRYPPIVLYGADNPVLLFEAATSSHLGLRIRLPGLFGCHDGRHQTLRLEKSPD